MKKGLMILTMALFATTIGVTSYAAAQDGVQTEVEKDGDKKKKKKKKGACATKEGETKSCAPKEGEKACCAKKK